jgi:hypothetical protein
MSDLSNTKAGDAVAVHESGGWGPGKLEMARVSRTTATRVVLENGSVWTRRGSMVGAGSWSRTWIEPWDEAKHPAMALAFSQERALARARSRLNEYKWREVTTEQAEAAIKLIESWAEPRVEAPPDRP